MIGERMKNWPHTYFNFSKHSHDTGLPPSLSRTDAPRKVRIVGSKDNNFRFLAFNVYICTGNREFALLKILDENRRETMLYR